MKVRKCASGLYEGLKKKVHQEYTKVKKNASGFYDGLKIVHQGDVYGTTYGGKGAHANGPLRYPLRSLMFHCASSVRLTPPSRGFVFNKSDTIFALARFNSHKQFLRFDNCFNLFVHCHEHFNSREVRQRSSITAMLPPFDTQTSNFVPTVVSVVFVIPLGNLVILENVATAPRRHPQASPPYSEFSPLRCPVYFFE